MNIGELTEGYFEMDLKQKKEVLNKILAQCIIQIEVVGVSPQELLEHIEQLKEKAVSREHYEVAEVFKVIKNKLLKVEFKAGRYEL